MGDTGVLLCLVRNGKVIGVSVSREEIMNQTYQPDSQFSRPSGNSNTLKIVLIILVGVIALMLLVCGVLAALLLPAVAAARTAAQRQMESNNLKQIGLAMLNYESAYRRFPAIHGINVHDEATGNWRIAVAPFLEHIEVFEQFDFNQTWDSPTNQRLANSMPELFRSPQANSAQPANHTNVFTIQDPNSIMPSGAVYRRISEVTDGLANTIAAIVLPEYSQPWMEPTDLTIAEALQHIHEAKHPEKIQLLLMDGAVISYENITDEDFSKMVTVNDGIVVGF
jgi:type II secretory pathway pseudopilin PulG